MVGVGPQHSKEVEEMKGKNENRRRKKRPSQQASKEGNPHVTFAKVLKNMNKQDVVAATYQSIENTKRFKRYSQDE